tara:strand:- start:83 stop:337 length:255 start_codon:yes stop_codon:yes gene_type:complete
MSKVKFNGQRLAEELRDKMFERVIELMPNVESGDVDPWETMLIDQAIERYVSHWVDWNGSEHYEVLDNYEFSKLSKDEREVQSV